jgi:hypothetical protein
MPSLTFNIDRIIARIPSEGRPAILDALSEIQTIIYGSDCAQTQKIDPLTGHPPLLVTVSGQLQYDVPSDCRRTAAVLFRPPRRGEVIWPACRHFNSDLPPISFLGRRYPAVRVSTRDTLPGAAGTITFTHDPGDTTDRYYHLYYIKPTPLTDETTDSLTLPDEVHYLLRQAVIAMFTSDEYGQSPLEQQTIENVAKKVRNALNRGYQASRGRVPCQIENQDVFGDGSDYYNYGRLRGGY